MNAQDGNVGRNFPVLQNVRLSFAQIFLGHRFDGCRLRNAVDVEQRRERHAHAHSDGEVGHHRQPKGHRPYRNIGLRHPEHAADFAPLAHVPRDDKQDGGERRQRNETRQRGGDEEDGEQGEGVNHP